MEKNFIFMIDHQPLHQHSGAFTKLISRSLPKTKTHISRNGDKSNTVSHSNANHTHSESTCSLLQIPNFQITTLNNQQKEQELNMPQTKAIKDYKSNKRLFGNQVLKSLSIREMEKNHQETIKLHKQQYEAYLYRSLFNTANRHKITKLPVKAKVKLSSFKVVRNSNRYSSVYTNRYCYNEEDKDDYIGVNSIRSISNGNKREIKRDEYIKNQITSLQAKVNLMQGITNLVYPQIVIKKAKEKTKHLYRPYRCIRECTPSQRNEMLISENNLKLTDYYSKSITVFNRNHSMTSFS